MSRLPFETILGSDLSVWLTGDLLSRPTYRPGHGHCPAARTNAEPVFAGSKSGRERRFVR